MASAALARRRRRVVTFRASREEIDRWSAIADWLDLDRSEWIRIVLERERRRWEHDRAEEKELGYYTCTCPEVPADAYCQLCGYAKRWTLYRRERNRQRMRRVRADARARVSSSEPSDAVEASS